MNNTVDSVRAVYERDAAVYDGKTRIFRYLLGIEPERRRLLQYASGSVLDLPTGTGLNFPYFSKDCTVTAADYSPEMLEIAKSRPEVANLDMIFDQVDAEDLPYDDNTFNTVSSMLGLCTYPNPSKAIAEMKRVCRNDGTLLFVDHGLSTWRSIASMQHRFNDWHVCKNACHLSREPLTLLQNSGLNIIEARQNCFGIITSVIAKPQ